MRNVLVTGSSGYIGSNTCKILKENGFKVIGVDVSAPNENISKYLDKIIYKDYNDLFNELKSVDYVVHTAATSLVGPSFENPIQYYNNNVKKLINFIDRLKIYDIEKTVFSSSAAVYKPSDFNLTEDSLTEPISPYGNTKLIGEKIISDSGINYTNLRYFNVCGVDNKGELGQKNDATHLISIASIKAVKKEKLIVNGKNYKTLDGTCIRDYISVEDVSRANLLALQSPNSNKQTYNVCGNMGHSNLQIVKMIEDRIDLEYDFGPNREGDSPKLVGSNTKIKKHLGWKPEVDITTIIDQTLSWYKKTL